MSVILDKLLKGRTFNWSSIGEIGEVRMCKRILKEQTSTNEEIPFYKIGTFGKKADAFISRKIFDEYKQKYNYPNKGEILISASGTIGRTVIFDGEDAYFQDSNIVWIEHDETKILNKFLYYVYQNVNWGASEGGTISRLYNDNLRKIQIPIPPLDVQAKIVKILDAFTALTAELTAELTMREKQYHYYRDKLLTFSDDEVEWKTLGEVVKMQAGKNIKASQISPSPTDEHIYPCYGGNGIRGYVNNSSHQGEYVLIGRQGALCGNVQRKKGDFYATEHAVVVTVSDLINVDWAYHMLTYMNLNQYASKSAQPGLAVGRIELLKIPVPDLAEQKRVAKILDKLDTLTHSITEGLPKEIALRQQQYEYYREQLLDFPK